MMKIRAGLSRARVKSFKRTKEQISFVFDNIKGNPKKIRFSNDGKIFSDYMPFTTFLNLKSEVLPSYFQLQSDMTFLQKYLKSNNSMPIFSENDFYLYNKH